MRCHHCDQSLGADDRFCPRCGAPSGPLQTFACPQCRAAAPAGSAFCPHCGAALYAPPAGSMPPAATAPAPVPGKGLDWSKIALGGAGGLVLGSLLSGHHGGLFGGDDHDEGWGGDWGGDGGD